jgi:hypothetical protein
MCMFVCVYLLHMIVLVYVTMYYVLEDVSVCVCLYMYT